MATYGVPSTQAKGKAYLSLQLGRQSYIVLQGKYTPGLHLYYKDTKRQTHTNICAHFCALLL